jgi:DNA replication protein DnaC
MTASKLIISHSTDEVSIDDAILAQRDVDAGFVYPIEDFSQKAHEFKSFVKDVIAIDPSIKEYDYTRNKNSTFKKYVGDLVHLYVRGNSVDVFGSIFCKSEEICADVWKAMLKYEDADESIDLFMHSYFINNGHLDDNSKQIKFEELNYISDKYYPYIDTQIMFDQFFTGAENILLLVGEPGLGKSKMSTLALKHAFKNPDKLPYDKLKDNPALDNQFITVVYVKSTDVLVNDKFWRELEKHEADFCIIDDLDYMLTKRDSEVTNAEDQKKNDFLNQFLSFTDGVEKHKTKFIITTNQKYDDIDSALLRKGRLFDILELRQLDHKEALNIWLDNELSETDFNELFTTHEVLPAELGSEIAKRLNTRISTATDSYLKEDGISKVLKAGRAKKIGI